MKIEGLKDVKDRNMERNAKFNKMKTANTTKGSGKKKVSHNLKGQSTITCFLEQNVKAQSILFKINSKEDCNTLKNPAADLTSQRGETKKTEAEKQTQHSAEQLQGGILDTK